MLQAQPCSIHLTCTVIETRTCDQEHPLWQGSIFQYRYHLKKAFTYYCSQVWFISCLLVLKTTIQSLVIQQQTACFQKKHLWKCTVC